MDRLLVWPPIYLFYYKWASKLVFIREVTLICIRLVDYNVVFGFIRLDRNIYLLAIGFHVAMVLVILGISLGLTFLFFWDSLF